MKIQTPIGGDGNPGIDMLSALFVRVQQIEIQLSRIGTEMDDHYEAFALALNDLYPAQRVRYEYYRCLIKARRYTMAIMGCTDRGNLPLLQELRSEYGMVKKAAEEDNFMDAIAAGEEEGKRLYDLQKAGKNKKTELQKGVLEIPKNDIKGE